MPTGVWRPEREPGAVASLRGEDSISELCRREGISLDSYPMSFGRLNTSFAVGVFAAHVADQFDIRRD